MSREELVSKYVEGQMSRRVFLRRLIGTGVATAAAIAYADVLASTPAGAAPVDLYVFMKDYAFDVKNADITLGENLTWAANARHSATDTTGMSFFDTGFLDPPNHFTQSFPVAGTYPYDCKHLSSTHLTHMTGRIRIPVRVTPKHASLGTKFQIKWAISVPAGYVADVQVKKPNGSFQDWKVNTTSKQTMFQPKAKGAYLFRCRQRKIAGGKHSAWSPTQTINVT